MCKPTILIPMGDPAGIGPEIVVKALVSENVKNQANCVVIGDKSVLEKNAEICGISASFNVISSMDEADFSSDVINLIDLQNAPLGSFEPGKVSGVCGKAAFEYIKKSIELALEKKADAVCTPPINKESLRAGLVPYIGHTEIFGELTDTADPLTLFEVRNMRVFFLSRHVSLRKACDMVTSVRVMDYVKRCTKALAQLGIKEGTMAVAGLNPHSGEHGLFGTEEMEAIVPAVEALKKQGYLVEGPVSADSVFHLALQGRYNSVLSLYHDQGHIATKTLDFERTIAITCGMPILRTSVDHGTAYDIAWQNKASFVSMEEAILVACKYCNQGEKGDLNE